MALPIRMSPQGQPSLALAFAKVKSWATIASVFVGCVAAVSCSRHAAEGSDALSDKEAWIEHVTALKPGDSRNDLLRLLPAGALNMPGLSSLTSCEFFIVSNRWEVFVESHYESERLLRAPVVTDMGKNAERAAHADPWGRATIRWLGSNAGTADHPEGAPVGAANRSQPVQPATNQAPAAAGSGR